MADNSRPLSELRDLGLLWLINRAVFHPRGYALALDVEDDGTVTGWRMLGDGSEPWRYASEVDEDTLFGDAEMFLASLRAGRQP